MVKGRGRARCKQKTVFVNAQGKSRIVHVRNNNIFKVAGA